MWKKITYAAAALIALAVIGCDGGKEPDPKQKPVEYVLTYDKNTTDEGSADPIPKTQTLTADNTGKARIEELPATAPNRPGYVFQGYSLKPEDVTGPFISAGYKFSDNISVYAQWEKIGAVKPDGDTLVQSIPPLEAAAGNAGGSVINADGSIKLFKGDSFDYRFPEEIYDDVNNPTYDFYKVDYSILERNWDNNGQAGSETSVFINQYGTSTRYTGWSNAANLMPWLSNPNNPLILEIKGANNTGGFRIYGNCNGNMTFKINSVTYYKAPKYTVTFDWNYTGKTPINPVNPVTVWGPYEDHPGYALGTQLPSAPDKSTETDAGGNAAPQYFLGWFDEATEYTDTSPITKNVTLKGKWTTTPPEKVEKITVSSNSGVPVYRFTLANQWADAVKGVSKITYTIWVNADATANRMHIVAPLTGIAANGSKIQANNWGDFRLVNVAGNSNVTAILAKGKNASGNAGGTGEWVTFEYVIGPAVSDVVSPENSGYVAGNYPAANTQKIYMGLGLSSNANTIVYHIKDVALILADGTKVANDSLDTTDNGTKLGAFYFAAGGTHPVVSRIMSNSPGSE